MKKRAFTLAETLITLGIIGVVAAMTLPTLITKYQKSVTVNRLKSTYSILSEALKLSEVQNGDISEWSFDEPSGNDKFAKYIKPYLKSIKEETSEKNGALGITYRRLSGEVAPEYGLRLMGHGGSSQIYTLSNGVQLMISNYVEKATGFLILIDINGYKKPNQFGKDVFFITISQEHKVHFWGRYSTDECSYESGETDRENLLNGSCYGYACNKNKQGVWCGALIQYDGWQIKDDYPW